MIDVAIDSRQIKPGQVFVALPGERSNGHDFLEQAIDVGASGLIIKKTELHRLKNLSQEKLKHVFVLPVPDPLAMLQELAMHWRMRFSYPIIGITGSVGKTTTKELLAHIVKAAGLNACVSYGNQNSTIGLPINILKMRDEHDVAIFEMGISNKGEMKQLVDMARPTIGVITNISHAHGQGLGSLEEIAEEKRKIFSRLGEGGVAVLLDTFSSYFHTRKTLEETALVNKNRIFECDTKWRVSRSTFNITHKGMRDAILIATKVAQHLGISSEVITNAIKSFRGVPGRFEQKKMKNNRGIVISDCYNANPESMCAAIHAVHQMPWKGNKIGVFGDMLELGEKEIALHQEIGSALHNATSFSEIILVGKRARYIAERAPKQMNCFFACDWQEAQEILSLKIKDKKSLVLVKASNGMQLGRLVARFAI